MNYINCETFFFLRFPEPLQPDMQAVTVFQNGRSYDEILFHVGKVIGENRIVVTKIE